jgi:hypothetical protein
MPDPRFSTARITSDGLTTEWTGVPTEEEQGTLVLSLSVLRDDGSEVRFGARWTRGEVDSPVVFAWDSRTVQERTHEAAETAISRDDGDVRVEFPRAWVDPLIDAHETRAVAVVAVDDIDGEATPFDFEPEV